jgi:hypothetical protein
MIKGTWILESYAVDSSKWIDVKDNLKKDKITFGTDGRYIKTYHVGTRIRMKYNSLDGKVTKKHFDKHGYELKVVRVRKKTINGTYEKMGSNEIRLLMEKDSKTKTIKIDGQRLIIADTLDKRVIRSRYKKRL